MQPLTRRKFMSAAGLMTVGVLAAACAPQVVKEVVKETVIQKETVVQEVEKVVTATAGPAAGYKGKFVVLSCGAVEREVDMIKEIEGAHPGLQIDWRNLTSDQYTELFAAADVAGDQIDLMDLNGQDLRRYAVAGKVLDLSEITYKDRFVPVSIDTYTLKGKLWAVPRGDISGWCLYYNKKAFQAIGVTKEIETYDELKQMAPELKKAGYAPMAHEGKTLYMWPVWHFILHAQTSKNLSIENTIKTLTGEMKFTDPEYIEALTWLQNYSKDGLFIENVLSMDGDGALLALKTGKAAMYHNWPWFIKDWRDNKYPDLDLGYISPLQVVPGVKRQNPGGTGRALCIYSKIGKERLDVAWQIIDTMTNDKWVEVMNKLDSSTVSCNKAIKPSTDPLAIKYGQESAPNLVIYEDWIWPPEITRSFQEVEQAVVAGAKTPQEAADTNQKVLDGLVKDGYQFVS